MAGLGPAIHAMTLPHAPRAHFVTPAKAGVHLFLQAQALKMDSRRPPSIFRACPNPARKLNAVI